jgi:hypothetical protein
METPNKKHVNHYVQLLSKRSNRIQHLSDPNAWATPELEPVETGISPVETFEKYPLLTLFWAMKTKMPHIFW